MNREWNGDTHILLLTEVSKDEFGYVEWEYELLHPPACKQVPDKAYSLHDGEVMITTLDCDVAWMEYEGGLEGSISYSGQSITSPGCYRIQGWGSKSYYFEWGWEYDNGIAVVGV